MKDIVKVIFVQKSSIRMINQETTLWYRRGRNYVSSVVDGD